MVFAGICGGRAPQMQEPGGASPSGSLFVFQRPAGMCTSAGRRYLWRFRLWSIRLRCALIGSSQAGCLPMPGEGCALGLKFFQVGVLGAGGRGMLFTPVPGVYWRGATGLYTCCPAGTCGARGRGMRSTLRPGTAGRGEAGRYTDPGSYGDGPWRVDRRKVGGGRKECPSATSIPCPGSPAVMAGAAMAGSASGAPAARISPSMAAMTIGFIREDLRFGPAWGISKPFCPAGGWIAGDILRHGAVRLLERISARLKMMVRRFSWGWRYLFSVMMRRCRLCLMMVGRRRRLHMRRRRRRLHMVVGRWRRMVMMRRRRIVGVIHNDAACGGHRDRPGKQQGHHAA